MSEQELALLKLAYTVIGLGLVGFLLILFLKDRKRHKPPIAAEILMFGTLFMAFVLIMWMIFGFPGAKTI